MHRLNVSDLFYFKVADTTVSWAPGYVIDATSMIDSESPKIDLGFTAFVGSVVSLSVALLAILFVLGILHFRH